MARRRRSSAVARFINWVLTPISLPVAGETSQSRASRRKSQRNLMASQKVRMKPNPKEAKKRTTNAKRNPATLTAREKRELETARRMSKQFHGNSQVIELNQKDRHVPRFAVAAGEISEMTYSPNRGSKRQGTDWHHKSGDRGPGKPRSRQKPLLVADPITKQPILLKHRSPMKFSSKRGLVG